MSLSNEIAAAKNNLSRLAERLKRATRVRGNPVLSHDLTEEIIAQMSETAELLDAIPGQALDALADNTPMKGTLR